MADDDDALGARDAMEESVEADFTRLKSFLALGWRKDPRYVQALIDRLTLEGLLDDVSRPRRRVYRVIADYFEDALDEREDADRNRERKHAGRRGYLRRMLGDG